MFFNDFKSHKNARIRESLLWEYDLLHFNWHKMSTVVIQRVIERGRKDDFYAILNLYGPKEIKENIKQIPYLNDRDISFVCSVFNLEKNDLKCYSKKQSTIQHWNS